MEPPPGPVRRVTVDEFGLIDCARHGREVVDTCRACELLVGARRNESGEVVEVVCRTDRPGEPSGIVPTGEARPGG